MAPSVSRAGRFVKQPSGYAAFVPEPLPPDPPIGMDGAMVGLLSRADQAVGRLDGVARTLPNPDLFVAMYVRRELRPAHGHQGGWQLGRLAPLLPSRRRRDR